MGFKLLKAFQGEARPLGGRYQILRQLGAGGFGQTFLARDLHLPDHPTCVIKQLKPQVSSAAQLQVARRLFDTEAKTLYKLGDHDQIPRLLAHFEENQDFYLAQELVEGHPLSEELRPMQPWTAEQVVSLLQDLLGVLTFVHGHHVIHRDIKPSNLIRRQRDGRVVLIDFGAVKQASTQLKSSNTGTHTISIGTQGYMPSEQLSGNPRFSSDLYAVGMIAIQALTGRHPMQFTVDPQTCEVVWRDRVADLPPELGDFLDQMVRYDFRTRYPAAADALEALNALPEDLRTAAPPLPWVPAASPLPPTAQNSEARDPTTPWPQASSALTQPETDSSPPLNAADRTAKTVAIAAPLLSQAGDRPWLVPAVGVTAAVGLAVIGLSLTLPRWGPSDPNDSEAIAPSPVRNEADSTSAAAPEAEAATVLAQIQEANTFRTDGNYQSALQAYDAAIAQDDTMPEAQWGRCYTLNKLGRFQDAVPACEAAIALQPEYADALWSKGYALEQQNQPEQALKLYDQAIALDSTHAEAWNNRGTALFQLGQIGAAYEAFDRAVQLQPDFSEAWSNRAAALWEQRQFDAALESINRAVETDPENAIAQDLRQQMRSVLGR
jgi:serine/threonine protein kinase/Tfp pilus assembly protein PilF